MTNTIQNTNAITDIERLKKRAEFLWVASGVKWGTKSALLQAKAPKTQGSVPIRIGFTATKRLGNAVTRNRAKRRLRAAADELFPTFARPGLDYVLIARPGALTQPYKLLLDDIKEALKRVHKRADSRANPGERGGRPNIERRETKKATS